MQLVSEYLSASAGSGKTFALSKRYCHLVMARFKPEEICALTFTRAATREIFAAIVERLIDPENKIGEVEGGLSREQALARILEALPRLQISTIDAFSSKLARLFAYELGLNPDFTLYEGGDSLEAQLIQRESVRRALSKTSGKSIDELLNLFDVQHADATASDALSARLRNFLNTFGNELDAHPEGWGDLTALDIKPLRRCEDREAVVQEALGYIENAKGDQVIKSAKGELSDAVFDGLRGLILEYHAGIKSLRSLKKMWGDKGYGVNKLIDYSRGAEVKIARTNVRIGPALSACMKLLAEDLLARDFEQTAAHTQRLHRALVALKAAQKALTDETGMLSFEALTKTLAQRVGNTISIRDVNAFYIAYRLDCAIRHLMIDEFQDTSTEQWSILSGIAHELAADPENGTFFYVGDTKQSIYGWRGGDVTLFGDTTRLPAIPEGPPLVESYRSCQTVINFINRLMVFELTPNSKGEPPPFWLEEAVEKWNQAWVTHIPAGSKKNQNGFVQMLGFGGNKEVWRREMAKQIAIRWRQLSGKQLTFAVLAFTNDALQDENGLLHHLRREGVPCAIQGKQRVSETPMGTLVIQLLHWMSDPRATLWATIAEKMGLLPEEDAAITLSKWMACVNQHGFTAWLEVLFGKDTPFYQKLSEADRNVLITIRQGLEAQDRQGCVEPAVARDALMAQTVPCSADKGVMQLMTVHQSKGLTFDVVFTIVAGDCVSKQPPDYEVGPNWVLERPILPEAYDHSLSLQAAADQRKLKRMRDTLCSLYVSVTRARREQIIFAPAKAIKTSNTRAKVLCQTIRNEHPLVHCYDEDLKPLVEEHFSDGAPDWWQEVPDREAEVNVKQEESPQWVKAREQESVEVELPSEHSKAQTLAEVLAKRATTARDYGISLHDRLAQIEWTDRPPMGMPAEIFATPIDEACELWRERPFSAQLSTDGTLRYIAGQFDRVHIFPQSRRAVIYDFKSTRLAEVTPAFETQLKDYRTALSQLLGFDEANIQMKLVFTRHGKVVEVSA